MRRTSTLIWVAFLLLAVLHPAVAQKSGGILRVEHRDNPPSASIHEEATISTVEPFSGLFNNLVVFDPPARRTSSTASSPNSRPVGPGAKTAAS